MLHVASVCTPWCMLLDVVPCCCAKFETGQTFSQQLMNISFVPWSPNRSATMLDPFAQLFQHCWGHARSLRMVYKDSWVVSFPQCIAGPNIVGSCCIRLHTTVNTQATTPNIAAQQCWELLRPFSRSLTTFVQYGIRSLTWRRAVQTDATTLNIVGPQCSFMFRVELFYEIFEINDFSRWLCENCKICKLNDFSRWPCENYKICRRPSSASFTFPCHFLLVALENVISLFPLFFQFSQHFCKILWFL